MDFVEDTMRLWFPDGVAHLSARELGKWYDRAGSVVMSLLDSYAVDGVLVDKPNNKESGESKENDDLSSYWD